MGGAQYPTIKNVKVTGTVTGSGVDVGGLAGNFVDSSVEDCYSEVKVRTSGSCVGGLVGHSKESTIKKCASNGVVDGSSSVGGLVGKCTNGTIENSFSNGSVTGTYGVGGLLGWLFLGGSVIDSYSIASIKANGDYGGMLGKNEGVVEHSYWCKALAGVETSAGGTELTLEQMKTQASYVGFDFTGASPIWVMKEYPELNYKFGEK